MTRPASSGFDEHAEHRTKHVSEPLAVAGLFPLRDRGFERAGDRLSIGVGRKCDSVTVAPHTTTSGIVRQCGTVGIC